MPKVTVVIEEDYTSETRERLEKLNISLGELARETGIDRSQVSRIFNTNLVPKIDTVQKIELAILAIRARRKNKKSK